MHELRKGPGPRYFPCDHYQECKAAAERQWPGCRWNCAGCRVYREAQKEHKIEESRRRLDMVEIEKNGRVPMRTCSVCGFEFFADLKHFDQDKNRSDGLRSECKACRRKKQKAYKAEERRLIREAREARQRGPVGQETIVAHLERLIKHHTAEAEKYRYHIEEAERYGKALAALKGE